jgi:transposase InsO family protein
MMVQMAAARSPPTRDPANSQLRLPTAIPRNDRSAILLSISRQPSSRNRVSAVQRLRPYASVSDARSSLGRYLTFYNTRRPHSSLDRKTPDQAYFNQPLLAAA